MSTDKYRAELRVFTEDENFFWSLRALKVFGELRIEPPQEGRTRKLETPYRITLPETVDLVTRFWEAATLYVQKTGVLKTARVPHLYTAHLIISEHLEEMSPSWTEFEKAAQNFTGIVPTTVYVKDIGEISWSFTNDYGGPPGDIPYRALKYQWSSMVPEKARKAKSLLRSPETIKRVFGYFKHYFG